MAVHVISIPMVGGGHASCFLVPTAFGKQRKSREDMLHGQEEPMSLRLRKRVDKMSHLHLRKSKAETTSLSP